MLPQAAPVTDSIHPPTRPRSSDPAPHPNVHRSPTDDAKEDDPKQKPKSAVTMDEMNLEKEKGPRASQHDMGWNAQRTFPLLPVAGEIFLLTFPFIERGNRLVDFGTGNLSGLRDPGLM